MSEWGRALLWIVALDWLTINQWMMDGCLRVVNWCSRGKKAKDEEKVHWVRFRFCTWRSLFLFFSCCWTCCIRKARPIHLFIIIHTQLLTRYFLIPSYTYNEAGKAGQRNVLWQRNALFCFSPGSGGMERSVWIIIVDCESTLRPVGTLRRTVGSLIFCRVDGDDVSFLSSFSRSNE